MSNIEFLQKFLFYSIAFVMLSATVQIYWNIWRMLKNRKKREEEEKLDNKEKNNNE